MHDAETRRRIDTCRDILVGKVPDPAQVGEWKESVAGATPNFHPVRQEKCWNSVENAGLAPRTPQHDTPRGNISSPQVAMRIDIICRNILLQSAPSYD